MFNFLYYIIFSLLLLTAFYLFGRVALYSLPADAKFFFKVSRFKSKAIEGNYISIGRGRISVFIYNTVRFTILIFWFFIALLLKMLFDISSFGIQIFFIALLLILTIPKEKIGRIRLPFFYLNEYIKTTTSERYNREIFWTISLLINLFTITGDKKMGSDYIVEQIIKTVNVTKPIYLKMLSMWNMNLKEEAVEYFSNEIGTKEARNLSRVFIKLDNLDVKNFKNQLINYKNSIKDERSTLRDKRSERNGVIIYSLAIFSALFVLINFLLLILSDVFSAFNTLPI